MTKTSRTIVIGNEKGGSGKSTTAVHLIVGLLLAGKRVASVDLDLRQRSLSRYLENRRAYAEARGLALPLPDHHEVADDEAALESLLGDLAASHDVVMLDTPGNDTRLTRIGHSFADILVTPLNDSLVDFDVLARVAADGSRVEGPSHYAEMVWQQKMARARRDGGSMDWIVLRNRLSHLDAHNKREVGRLLGDLAGRIGFRIIPGFGERVIYRQLFVQGLTVMDLQDTGDGMNMSHIAARQEVRSLVEALHLP